MRVFGMIANKHTTDYTGHALETFFQTTPFTSEDRFYLIDNDGHADEIPGIKKHRLEIIKNPELKGFATNVNIVMQRALPAQADIFFLNNDLIFTEGWLEPLLVKQPGLFSPLSNREIQFQSSTMLWKNALALSDYLGKEAEFKDTVAQYRAQAKGYHAVISLPFFCIKIPFSVYSVVGPFDERFGGCGAEDYDYCIRCMLAGFPIFYATQSYVLHFSGKSTWAGPEAEKDTKARVERFRAEFGKKWGEKLLDLYINENQKVITQDPELMAFIGSINFKGLIEKLVP